jgi:branched-chain amino acid transport system ATP-binding protein
MNTTLDIETPAPPAQATASRGLQVQGLCAGYGKALVLEQLDLVVPEGQVVAVVGPNGAGKSTLVKSISGVLKPRGGSVRFNGETLSGLAPHQIARKGILHVPETRDIFGGMTVWENLQVAFDNLNGQGDAKQAFDEVYALFPILHQFRARTAGNLSGGQQQMLAIARALLGRPKLLMLDEPSLGLASLIIREIYNNLERLRGTGLTVLLVEQNAKMAVNFAEYSVVLANGVVVLEGTRAELAGNENLIHHYLGGASRPKA